MGLRERLLPVLTVGVLAASLPAVVLVLLGDVTVSLTARCTSTRLGSARSQPRRPRAASRGGRAAVGHADGAGRNCFRGDGEPARAARLLHARRVVRQQRRRRDHRRRNPDGRRGDPRALDLPSAELPADMRALLCSRAFCLAVLGLGASALASPSLLPAVPAPNSERPGNARCRPHGVRAVDPAGVSYVPAHAARARPRRGRRARVARNCLVPA